MGGNSVDILCVAGFAWWQRKLLYNAGRNLLRLCTGQLPGAVRADPVVPRAKSIASKVRAHVQRALPPQRRDESPQGRDQSLSAKADLAEMLSLDGGAEDPDGFILSEAQLFATLSDLVYFGDNVWQSRKPKKDTSARASPSKTSWWASSKVDEGSNQELRRTQQLSPPLRFKTGDLARMGKAQPVAEYQFCGRFRLRTLGDEYNRRESAVRTIYNGLVEGRQQHDTDALLCELHDLMRPGEKSLVLIFRGTEAGNLKENSKDVWTDLNGGMRPTKKVNEPGGLKTNGLVHEGFWGAWEEVRSLLNLTVDSLLKTEAYTGVFVTGHSLGGALATLAAMSISQNILADFPRVRLKCYTFGSPRVGDSLFKSDYDKQVPWTYRVQNDEDIVPHLPLKVCGFRHVGVNVFMNGNGIWVLESSAGTAEGALSSEDLDDDKPLSVSLSAWVASNSAEKVEDHSTSGYKKQLARFGYLRHMPHALIPNPGRPFREGSYSTWIPRAWKALITPPLKYRILSADHSKCLEHGRCFCELDAHVVESEPEPNEAGMAKILDQYGHLSQRNLTGADILMEAQYQAGIQAGARTAANSPFANIQYTHFEVAVAKMLFSPEEVLYHRQEVLENKGLFEAYDSNDDGFLTWSEFQTLCADCYPDISELEAKSFLAEMAAEHALPLEHEEVSTRVGELSLAEFSMWKRLMMQR